MVWISRIKVSCPLNPRKDRYARFVGPTSGEALKKGIAFQPGPGCRKGTIEMIKRGPGAGAVDRFEGGKRKRRKRRRRR